MRFLSWGDFTFPFEWGLYWAKHLYVWSLQSGTPNPDGLIRLPGRLLNFLVFGASDNVVVGYFYIFSSLIIAFIAFWLFARTFLQVQRTSVQLLGALFFACNPIFLGNLAKVGLVLAASMLPLCLLAIRAAFVHKKFRFFLLYIICLNLSFLHPYTFTVNAAVSGAYLLWLLLRHRAWLRDTWLKFALTGLFALAVNMYFVLPMLAMGTVSKDVISTNISPTPVDYTALVGVSNTGDLFTGFSLSKNVFVDFAFYNSTYQNVYFFGVFAFYVLLFGLYILTERRLTLTDKRRLGVLFGSFLVLVALAATTIAHLDSLIKFLIGLPGGWAFRSPLKWQLYIPLALFGILVVLLNRVQRRGKLFALQAGLLATFVIMNGYVAAEVFAKLLTPRSPTYFANLLSRDMTGKTVLFVNNGACMDFMRTYPAVTTELNQIFGSKHTQLKHVLEDTIDRVNLSGYDYVLGCFDHAQTTLTTQYAFKPVDSFVDNTFRLYANERPRPAVAAVDQLYSVAEPQAIGATAHFVHNILGQPFSFVTNDAVSASRLHDAFANLAPRMITSGQARVQLPARPEKTQLVPDGQRLFFGLSSTELILSKTAQVGLEPMPPTGIALPASITTLRYRDDTLRPENLAANGSLESGLWQPEVGDCYAYDNQPAIAQRLSTTQPADGHQALELSALRHIACTGPDSIAVQEGQHYLLSFDYKSLDGGKFAGFYAGFDDTAETVVSGRMQNNSTGWQSFSKEIVAPPGARELRVLLYAFPDSYGERRRTVQYDRLSLMPIPPLQNRWYLVGKPGTALQKPTDIQYETINPTRTLVHIRGAAQPFYLTTNQSYHAQWQAELHTSTKKIQLPFAHRTNINNHAKLDDTMNAWYINPAELCGRSPDCKTGSNGSYDFTVIIEFAPQRWFYLGGAISLAAVVVGSAYYLYDRRRSEFTSEGRWRWRA